MGPVKIEQCPLPIGIDKNLIGSHIAVTKDRITVIRRGANQSIDNFRESGRRLGQHAGNPLRHSRRVLRHLAMCQHWQPD